MGLELVEHSGCCCQCHILNLAYQGTDIKTLSPLDVRILLGYSESMLSKFLKTTRKRRGQTQAEAAHQVGVARATWMAWERGQMPTAPFLFELADWSEVPLNELRRHFQKTA